MIKKITDSINNKLEKVLSKIGIRKLFVILLLSFGAVAGMIFLFATYKTMYQTVYDERVGKLKYMADFAMVVVNSQDHLVLKKKKTLKQAQKDTIEMFKKVRFENNDYIWINGYNGKMIYHPYKQLIGKNVKTFVDAKGNHFGQKFIDIVEEKGDGYVQYYWTKIDSAKDTVYPKVSYVIGYKDWNWIIGSGVYTDDINAKVIKSMINGVIPVFIAFWVMLSLFLYVVWATIVLPIEDLANKSLKLADNDLDVTVSSSNNNTELGKLYTAFNKFVDFFKEKKQNEEKLSLILDGIVDVLVTVNSRGLIQSANPAVERMFGYEPQEVIGMSFDNLTYPCLFGSGFDNLDEIIYDNGKYELRGVKKNKETFFIEVSITEVVYKYDNLFILLVRDITEQKEVEKLKTEFVSVVSHELRTPLTAIRASLGMVLSGIFPNINGKVKELLDIAHNNSLRLIDLINDILDIEKIAAGKMEFNFEQLEVFPLVKDTISINVPYADKYKVRYSVQSAIFDDTKINVDKNRFVQVLTNLLSNATKFSPEGGSVEVSLKKSDSQVRISVKDHGQGVPLEFRDKLFQQFTQADSSDARQKGGTGLGLNICKSLVEQMRGKISFESEIGKGTVFHIDFPIA